MRQSITLNTPNAQRIYNRTYEEVGRNLYSVNVVSRMVVKDDEAVDELNRLIDERFAATQEEVDAEIERIKTLRDQNGIEALPEYTNPHTFECEISTPATLKYIKLVKGIDEISMLLDSLWLMEEITDKQKLSEEYRWQSTMIKLSNQFRDLYNRSRAASKRQRKEEAEENTKRKAEKRASQPNEGDPTQPSNDDSLDLAAAQ